MNELFETYNNLYVNNGFNHLKINENPLNWNQYYLTYESFLKSYEDCYSLNKDDILNRYQIYDNKEHKFIDFNELDNDSIDYCLKYLQQIEVECKLLQEKIKKLKKID